MQPVREERSAHTSRGRGVREERDTKEKLAANKDIFITSHQGSKSVKTTVRYHCTLSGMAILKKDR